MNSDKMKPEYADRKCGFHYSVIVHMISWLLTYSSYFSFNVCKGKSEAQVQLHINILMSVYASLDLILGDLFMQMFVAERNSGDL